MSDCGYLRIASEQDRITVAAILYKHGYSVTPARKKKRVGNGYDYFIKYETKPLTVTEVDE